MKKFVLAAAAIAAVATPLVAQQMARPQSGAGMTRAQVESRVRERFAQVDANRDGFVTKAEGETMRERIRGERRENRTERRTARFAALDANKDGQLSRAEFDAPRDGDRADRRERRMERRAFRAHHRGLARFGGARLFERLDADRDSRVSLAEATGAALRRFDMSDANKDGTVTREERRAVRAAHHKQG